MGPLESKRKKKGLEPSGYQLAGGKSVESKREKKKTEGGKERAGRGRHRQKRASKETKERAVDVGKACHVLVGP